MRKLFPLVLALLGLTLGGCFSDSGDPSPDPETGSTGIDEKWGVESGSTPSGLYAFFDPPALLPYPNDVTGFAGTTDGTLNLDPQLTTLQLLANPDFGAPVNLMDGFSTFARITFNFSQGIDPDSLDPTVNPLNAFAVVMVEVTQDLQTKVVTGVAGLPLQPGVDFTVAVADDLSSGDQILEIMPLKPLNPKSGYLVIVTNQVTDTQGIPAIADNAYEQIKQAYLAGLIQLPPPEGAELTDEEKIALFFAAHLAVVEGLQAAGLPISVEQTIVSTSFSTVSTTDALEYVDDTATAQFSQIAQLLAPTDIPIPDGGVLPEGTPITTGVVLQLLGFDSQCAPTMTFPLPGCGLSYAGVMGMPYFLEPPENPNDPIAVTSIWEGTPGVNPLDRESITLSRFNPVVQKKADLTIPVIMNVPGPNSQYALAGGTKPPEGWPVVIFMHGLGGNRLQIYPISEAFNNAGFAAIAVDHPLHGITATDPAEDPTALFRIPGVDERHFDLDIIDNETGQAPPDGIIDPTFLNYFFVSPDRLLPSGDHFRESASTVIHLVRTIPTMDIDGDGNADLDGSRIHFVGLSLGGWAGAILHAVHDDVVSATLNVAGGGITGNLFEAPAFRDTLGAALVEVLASSGFLPNSTVFNNYLRDGQNLVDAGDPINYGLAWGNDQAIPLLIHKVVGDTVVSNESTDRLVLAMGIPQVPTATPPGFPWPVLVGPDTGGVNGGLVTFTAGSHGSLLDPSASLQTTLEMQTQVVVFAAGNAPAMIPGDGQVILISDPTVVDVDGP